MSRSALTRRDFLHCSAAAAAALTTATVANAAPEKKTPPKGKAEACIFLWLGGGAAHIDTFDPKRRGDPKQKKAGSYYDAINTAVRGVQVCEHLKRCAAVMDRIVPVRTLNHNVIDEHAAAVNRLHTGRSITETVLYPSVGSVIAHQRGPRNDKVPAYIVIGYPNVTRGPGFLGSPYSYLYLTDTEAGPAGLQRPPEIGAGRQSRREALLDKLRDGYLKRNGDDTVKDYADAAASGFRMAGPSFMKVFNLASEPATLRESYGGEFGQRCLLARRLVQSGVRFVEVSFNLNFTNGTGWDTHNEGQLNQHLLIDELDRAMSTLITDLEKQRMMDETLIVVATEFGRPPEFDAGGGRGHHSKAFSGVLAGGGLRTGQAVGVTDELGKLPVERPVSIPDFHASIYAALGIDTTTELYAGDRPVPITDGGRPLKELF
jgi:hypothetical protein